MQTPPDRLADAWTANYFAVPAGIGLRRSLATVGSGGARFVRTARLQETCELRSMADKGAELFETRELPPEMAKRDLRSG